MSHATEAQGFRLSPAQEHVWRVSAQGTRLGHVSCVVSLEGALDECAFAAAWREVVLRHESVRTTFQQWPGMNLPVQVVGETPPALIVLDWTDVGSDPSAIAPRIAAVVASLQSRPLDAHDAPLGAALCRLGERHFRLILTAPALGADRRSLVNIGRQVIEVYETGPNDSAESMAPMQYADYAEWHQQLLETEESADAVSWWMQQQLDQRHALSWDSSPPHATEDARVESVVSHGRVAAEDIDRLAASESVSPNAVLFAVWAATLRVHVQQASFTIGYWCEGREPAELQDATGLFERHVPLRIGIDPGQRWLDLMSDLDWRTRTATERQEFFSWERLLDDADANPRSFAALYEYRDEPLPIRSPRLTGQFEFVSFTPDAAGASPSGGDAGGGGRFGVSLSVTRTPEAYVLTLRHTGRPDGDQEPPRWLARYRVALAAALQSPRGRIADLDLLTDDDRARLRSLRATADVEVSTSLSAMIEACARVRPDAPAVADVHRVLSYADLDREATQLATRLHHAGAGPETRVAVHMRAVPEMITALVGTLKAGAAYVPLDPSYPPERLAHMLRDSGATILIHESGLASPGAFEGHTIERVIGTPFTGAAIDADTVLPSPDEETLAYVIYTSGSTGLPKGVGVTRRNLAASTAARAAFYDTPPARFLLLSSFAFDSSVAGIFWTLSTGGCLHLATDDQRRDPAELVLLLAANGISHLLSLPALYRAMLDTTEMPATLRTVIVAGEACPPDVVDRHVRRCPSARLYNEYGPTEASVWATAAELHAHHANAARVPIGKPIPGAHVHIVDRELRLVPPGVAGEVAIGGRGVSRGYLGQPAATAAAFLPDPFADTPGARLYRTGDAARHDITRRVPGDESSDCELEHLGRFDQQIKIRGHRVEPGEIEAVLARHPSIEHGVVVARDERSGSPTLAAFVVAGRDHAPDPAMLYDPGIGCGIVYFHRDETDAVYQEVFTEQCYLRHGITLADGDCVFDVGAHIGLFTLFVHAACRDARVFAFEPLPPTVRKLRANIARCEVNAVVCPFGLSDREGDASFIFYPNWTPMSGAYADPGADTALVRASLGQYDEARRDWGESALARRFQGRPFTCRTRTLSSVIAEHGIATIDLLKIDVEKSEADVLRGIAESDWPKIRHIVLEVHDEGDRRRTVVDLVENHGFETVVEQAASLTGTNLFQLYARNRAFVAPRPAGTARRLTSRALPSRPSAGELRTYLGQRLPAHMIPAEVVWVDDDLPRTPSGKIDRDALSRLSREASPDEARATRPRTPIEDIMCDIWSAALERERVDVTDHFFTLGGHSILAMKVIARVRDVFEVQISVRALFEAPTVERFAAVVSNRLTAREEQPSSSIGRQSRDTDLPLSYGQQGLWVLHQIAPESTAYVLPLTLSAVGDVRLDALEAALSALVQRHEVLRTRIVTRDGRAVQEVLDPPPIRVPVVDLRALPEVVRESAAHCVARTAGQQPFELAEAPLLRSTLVWRGEREWMLLFATHHIVSDGWSLEIFARELAHLYRQAVTGTREPLPPLPIQYADYALWQRSAANDEATERAHAYWHGQLGDLTPATLTADLTDEHRSGRGAKVSVEISAEIAQALRLIGKDASVTPFMILFSAYGVLLHHLTGTRDVVIGAPTANRARSELAPLIGFFANILLLRARAGKVDSFRGFLSGVRAMVLEAYAHQDVSLDQVRRALGPGRDVQAPLFQTTFALQNIAVRTPQLPGLTLTPVDLDYESTMFDLMLDLWDAESGGLHGMVRYRTDRFLESTARLWARMYESIVEAIAVDPNVTLSRLHEGLDALRAADEAAREETRQRAQDEQMAAARARRARQAQMAADDVVMTPLTPGRDFVAMVRPSAPRAVLSLTTWFPERRARIEEWLTRYGAVLFRGFRFETGAVFDQVMAASGWDLLEYGERSSPRTRVRPNVYTSTDHRADQSIFFHNENSYQHRWPGKLAFFCVQPAARGGRTPLSDCRAVLARLPESVRDRFARHGVLYVRNFGDGVGLPWTTVFDTDDPSCVEAYCAQAGIMCEWRDGGDRLRTRQVRPAIITHPHTGDAIWFNHAAFFHVTTLDPVTRQVMCDTYADDELPANTFYGDGTPIDPAIVEQIRDAYHEESVAFDWQRHDLLLIDNARTAHARTPFTGTRRILVAMLQPCVAGQTIA